MDDLESFINHTDIFTEETCDQSTVHAPQDWEDRPMHK